MADKLRKAIQLHGEHLQSKKSPSMASQQKLQRLLKGHEREMKGKR